MLRHYLIASVFGGTFLLAAPAFADVSSGFYVGAETTTGDYGFEADTAVERLPVGASLTAGRVTLFGEAAYLRADGFGDAIRQSTASGYSGRVSRLAQLRGRLADDVADADATVEEPMQQTVSGWGDTLIGANLRLTPAQFGAHAGLTVSATAPTGDEETGLGAGEWTYAASLDGEKRWNAFFLRASGGGLIGESGGDARAFGSLAAGYDLTSRVTTALSLSWAEALDGYADDPSEAALSASYRLNNGIYLSSYVLTGLTDASPDIGGGISLSVSQTR